MSASRGRVGWLWVVMLVVAGAPVCAADDTRLAEAGAMVDAVRLQRDAVVLASDAFEGRAPGTAGGDRSADYLARRLAEIGAQAVAGHDGFRRPVPLVGSRPGQGCRLQLTSLGETRALRLGADYLLASTGDATWVPRWTPLVFVGYGIAAPEFDYDDYAAVDVAGKVAVFLEGEPRSRDPDWFGGDAPTVYAALETKRRSALARGAVGSVMVSLPRADASHWERLRRDYAFEHLELAWGVPSHLSVILRWEVAAPLFEDALYGVAEVLRSHLEGTTRSFHLPVMLRFEGDFDRRELTASNLVGVLPGTDPGVADEAVVVLAHYDHLGAGPADDGGDRIYNGMVDNALGVAGVLEVARVLVDVRFRPRRSVLIVLTTAEEWGALGSRFLLENPPLATERMIAAVNVDGLAFLEPLENVWVVGGELSDLGERVARAARSVGVDAGDPPDEAWSREAFVRSDQVAFAEAGVPVVLISEALTGDVDDPGSGMALGRTWMSTLYHSPRDDGSQPVLWSAAADHVRVLVAAVMSIGDARSAPAWRPGVPYAYERLLRQAAEGRRR
jgi:hypothetical protein